MAKTYRAAIIGCGGRAIGRPDVAPDRANRTHAAAYMECDRTELVAAADFRREALYRLQTVSEVPGEHLYTDFRELIDREKPDIVSIGDAGGATSGDHGLRCRERGQRDIRGEADGGLDARG